MQVDSVFVNKRIELILIDDFYVPYNNILVCEGNRLRNTDSIPESLAEMIVETFKLLFEQKSSLLVAMSFLNHKNILISVF